ncbi:MAG: glycosyl hydrolase family 18 protein [Defluviitaleaceae bacterium]|nr:glycosyl hydrolase family 18 protein [Defluviitaleaceae bacterium]
MNSNSRKMLPFLIIGGGIVLAVGFLVVSLFLSREGGFGGGNDSRVNMTEIGFFEHHQHLSQDRITLAVGGELLQGANPPVYIDGQLYLPVDFLRSYVDRYIFWEQNTSRLSISTADYVARFTPGASTYTVNWDARPLDHPIRQIGDMAFMAADMVQSRYPVSFNFQRENNILIAEFDNEPRTVYRTSFDTEGEDGQQWIPMRAGASTDYPILSRLMQDELLTFIRQFDDFYLVRKQNGLMGYVDGNYLILDDFTPGVAQMEARRPITRPSRFSGDINMVWHLVTSPAAAANSAAWEAYRGINVISPTWLYFCRESYDGTIINFGNREYVQWAHQNGMEVWPMISDAFFSPATGPEVFSNEAARLVLLDANIRDYVISQIMDMVARYNWDGINVDYEEVWAAEGEHFIQFLRELSVPMRQAGAVLSVAVFPPAPHNMWWNRTEIAKAVDFLTMMTYDEHWRTHPRPGSVASFPFVRNAVLTTLEEVPAEQLVMGLPTYMRVWTEQFNNQTGEWELLPGGPGGEPLPEFYPFRRVRDPGMQFGRNIIERDMGGTFVWDYELRQYVAHIYHTHNGIELRTSAWLNCLRSVQEKLGLYTQHDLAGVTWWRKGLGLPAMWEVVDGIVR